MPSWPAVSGTETARRKPSCSGGGPARARKLGHLGADYGNKTSASLWGGHWGVGWDGVYAPGDLITQVDICVEVLVYSLDQNKLVWAGQSSTSNPRSAGKLVQEVVKKVAAEMKKAGLIREGGP